MRILVIDDEPEIASLLGMAVEESGHEAITATHGALALALLESTRPDAVFLDVVMSPLTGIDVLREIRGRYPDLPVILITGNASSDQVAEAERLGITDCVQKPFALTRVDQVVNRLRARRTQREA
jgi:DNA-binding NtrC family response regulator